MANPAPVIINPVDLLTPAQLADRLQVKPSWVFERTRARRSAGPPLPFMRVGKHLRFSWAAVSVWLTSTATTAPTRVRRYRRKSRATKTGENK